MRALILVILCASVSLPVSALATDHSGGDSIWGQGNRNKASVVDAGARNRDKENIWDQGNRHKEPIVDQGNRKKEDIFSQGNGAKPE